LAGYVGGWRSLKGISVGPWNYGDSAANEDHFGRPISTNLDVLNLLPRLIAFGVHFACVILASRHAIAACLDHPHHHAPHPARVAALYDSFTQRRNRNREGRPHAPYALAGGMQRR
jgi:hypothetical protein